MTGSPRRRAVRPGQRDLDRPLGRCSPRRRWLADTTATVLRDGKVLVAGQDGAQLYDPDSGTWSATGKMITPRHHHTATLLPDGRVLVAGGTNASDGMVYSAELYDPDTGSWTATANMRDGGRCRSGCPRGGGMATLLQDGTVLSCADLRALASRSWRSTTRPPEPGPPTRRASLGWTADATATLLLDGTVLVTQGSDASEGGRAVRPGTGSWTSAGTMPQVHQGAPATLLLDGTVLVAGGNECQPGSGCWILGTAELYVPAGVSPPAAVVALPIPSPTPPVPTPTPIPTPFPPAAGPVPADARILDGHGRQQELRTRDAVPGRGRRERHRPAVRVRDPERRASRRHQEGDLPAPAEAGDGLLDLGEPGSGPRGIVLPDVRRTHGGQVRHFGRRERPPGSLGRPVGQ